MTAAVTVLEGGPHLTVQDLGRPGYLAFGLSRGGAVDRLALYEGAALLGQSAGLAAIEMAGRGGVFETGADLTIALTGPPMAARLDGAPLRWNASHLWPGGTRLAIGAAVAGGYGYLHVAGGIQTPEWLGSRSVHLAAGIGRSLDAGDSLPVRPGATPIGHGWRLDVAQRVDGGAIRVVPSLQTEDFTPAERDRFADTRFRRDMRGNRMGQRLLPDGTGFASDAGLSVLSEITVPGDIQIAGDGMPYVLLAECQTTGGYPRIGTILPADLPRVAQAGFSAELRFQFVDPDTALGIERAYRADLERLGAGRKRLVTRAEDVPDLLSYNLISGVTAGDPPEGAET
ncbi:MAG: urea amidolyase [Paracoccaceae bacterium]|nr:urea amidolyase [Paracoccaceae bacterium]